MTEETRRTGTAAEAPAPAGRAPAGRRRVPLVWAAVFAAALAFCGIAAFTYARTAGDDDRAFAQQRDEVLNAGREHLAQLNSMDADQVQPGLRRWLDATTGPLRSELKSSNAKSAEAFRQSRTSVRGTVTDASVTELDTRAGAAKLIATVRVEQQAPSGEPAVDRKRFEAGMASTADGWKVKSLTAITVGG